MVGGTPWQMHSDIVAIFVIFMALELPVYYLQGINLLTMRCQENNVITMDVKSRRAGPGIYASALGVVFISSTLGRKKGGFGFPFTGHCSYLLNLNINE